MSDELMNVEFNEAKGKITKAKLGEIVQIKRGPKKGKQGKVIVIRDNSVIVDLGMNPKTNEPIKTVVNHKNYKRTRGK